MMDGSAILLVGAGFHAIANKGKSTHLEIAGQRIHDLFRADILVHKDVLAVGERVQGLL
jgi:hypothetical protein